MLGLHTDGLVSIKSDSVFNRFYILLKSKKNSCGEYFLTQTQSDLKGKHKAKATNFFNVFLCIILVGSNEVMGKGVVR